MFPRRATWGNGTDQQSDEQNARFLQFLCNLSGQLQVFYVLHPGWIAVVLLARTVPAQCPPSARHSARYRAHYENTWGL